MNRTGTYVAFDGLGKENPCESDFRYYATLQAWNSNNNIAFSFVNSHEKASAVRDTSKLKTLMASIQQRLSGSKNMLVILSSNTRKIGSLLSYEIEMAVDSYRIPLIITYVDYCVIAKPYELKNRWPFVLNDRIGKPGTAGIHIPFIKDIVLMAINQFSPSNLPHGNGNSVYSKDIYRSLGLLQPYEDFQNKKK